MIQREKQGELHRKSNRDAVLLQSQASPVFLTDLSASAATTFSMFVTRAFSQLSSLDWPLVP